MSRYEREVRAGRKARGIEVSEEAIRISLLRARVFNVSRDMQRMLTMHERAVGVHDAGTADELFSDL